MLKQPGLGHGIGLRTVHFPHLLENDPEGIDWFEIISENFFCEGGRPWAVLNKVREKLPIVMHGVSLAIGNASPLNKEHLKQLKTLADKIQPALISDHICWGGFGGHYAHDLLPLPYTEEVVNHVVSKVIQVQEYLGRQILLENASSYVSFRESEMTEWEFVTEIATRADCGVLLDLNNIYVSANNHSFDVDDYLQGVPADRIGQFHIAGHTDKGDYLLDTHIGPTIPEVWDVYRKALRLFGSVPTLIEWDEDIPPFEDVVAESTIAVKIEKEVLGDNLRENRKGGS